MKIFAKLNSSCVAAILFGMMSTTVVAGNSTGLVTQAVVFSNGNLFQFVAGTIVSPQTTCIQVQQNAWRVSLETVAGKAIFQQVNLAYATGKSVYVTGTGTCDPSFGYELVASVVVSG